MGEIRKMDLQNINEYLQYAYKPINKEKVIAGALLNISALCIGIYYMHDCVLIKSGLIIGVLLISCNILVFFAKKSCTIKQLNLYHGIYKMLLMVSFGILFGISLYPLMGRGVCLLALVLFLTEIIIAYGIWRMTIKMIESGNFPEKGKQSIVTSSMGLAVAVAAPAINDTIGFGGGLGIACGVLTLEGITSISNFAKAYCYHILEEDEKKSIIRENVIMLVESSGCHFCEQAKAWLREHEVTYVLRNITEEKIRMSEIKNWHEQSGLPISRFLNVQSIPYKSMRLKERLPAMTDEEVYREIVNNELLIKKPLIVCKDFVLVGFREYEWEEKFKKK